MPVVPFKLNQDRRRHIPRQRHKVTNWPAYDASLRQRGSLTVWFTDEAIAAWAAEPRTTRGGQPWYSPLAILTALTIRAVFRLAYRQAEGCQRRLNSPQIGRSNFPHFVTVQSRPYPCGGSMPARSVRSRSTMAHS